MTSEAVAPSNRLSDSADAPVVAFAMDQIAGHVTNYRNLRHSIEADEPLRIDPRWIEVDYHKPGGRIERVADALRVIPSYPTGVGRGTLEMRRGLRTHSDADVIFTNASVALFFCRRFSKTPTLYDFDSTPHQLDEMEAYTPEQDPAPVERLKFVMQRRLFRDATRLQAWSHWAKQSVVDDYGIDPDKIVVNPPGIDLENWAPVEREFHRDARRPARVLLVGGDFDRKGGPDLLDWFKGQSSTEIEIDIVTREPVDAPPGVRIHNDLGPNDPELLRLYGAADVFVLPSRGECFGIAAIEAMATGLPVVQSTVGGAHDIVEEGGNGFLVPPADPAALGRAINAILEDPQKWAAMRTRSHELAVLKFDLQVTTRRTVDQLIELAEL